MKAQLAGFQNFGSSTEELSYLKHSGKDTVR
jgi:hypothetical protein